MGDKKFVLAIVAISFFALIGGMFWVLKASGPAQVETNLQAKLVVAETFHDWGEIGIDDGKVEAEFEIKNEGEQNLRLFNVSTSCMCTTAQFILGESESPIFGMHGKSDYVLEVAPEETARLKVVFDPAFHGPSGVGPINRQIEVMTNDAAKEKLQFILTATVRR